MNSAKDEIVEFFLCDIDLKQLFTAAIEDPNIGGDRLERNFRRLLVDFSRELLVAADNRVLRETAKLIEKSAPYISENVRRQLQPEPFSKSFPKPDDPNEKSWRQKRLNDYLEALQEHYHISGGVELGSDLRENRAGEQDNKAKSSKSENDDTSEISLEPGTNENLIMTALEEVKEFLRSGAPLENLKTGLRNFISPRKRQLEEEAPGGGTASHSEKNKPISTKATRRVQKLSGEYGEVRSTPRS